MKKAPPSYESGCSMESASERGAAASFRLEFVLASEMRHLPYDAAASSNHTLPSPPRQGTALPDTSQAVFVRPQPPMGMEMHTAMVVL
jgi:hypothetical protein